MYGSMLSKTGRRLVISTFALAFVALIAPGAAQAGPLVASAPDCAEESLDQPFLPWLDPAQYQFAPDGGFENGGEGWALGGGVDDVAGNETHFLHSSGDARSLSIPAGGSATSPTVCVGLEHPTLRFIARKVSGVAPAMTVEALFEDATGTVRSLVIGSVAGSSAWEPTAPMPIVANLLPLLPGDHTPVRFRFTALSGGWAIDDVYVDPYSKR